MAKSGLLKDIETAEDYQEYRDRFELGTRGMDTLSSGPCPGCDDCELPEEPTDEEYALAGESWFSWYPCSICQRQLGGDRVAIHWIDGGEIQHSSCCLDCQYFMEYGQLDDMTMLKVESR